jgi:hypothetical protein
MSVYCHNSFVAKRMEIEAFVVAKLLQPENKQLLENLREFVPWWLKAPDHVATQYHPFCDAMIACGINDNVCFCIGYTSVFVDFFCANQFVSTSQTLKRKRDDADDDEI